MNKSTGSHAMERLFGMRAARLGLVTMEQVEKALAIQRMLDKNGQHQPIGMILTDLGMLTTTQLLAVLRTYDDHAQKSLE